MQSMLPSGWQQKCYDLKAIERGRLFKNPSDLLEMVFTYLTVTNSFGLTAGVMAAKDVKISKVAVHQRFKASGDWLRWLVQGLIDKFGIILTKPKWLENKSVVLVDGSSVSLRGSSGTDHILHMQFDLFNFCYKSLNITTVKEGEKISRFEVDKNAIVIGDRGYVSIAGIEHILKGEGEFIFRYRTRAFNLYDKDGKKLELTAFLDGLGDFECRDIDCYYLSEGKLKPLRVCIMKKDEIALKRQGKQLKQNFTQKEIDNMSDETVELNKYIILCTNLKYATNNVFELYRNRWQVELIFKELKTVLSFGEVPSSNPDSIKAWFYGKLLIASLSLLLLNEGHFPPKG